MLRSIIGLIVVACSIAQGALAASTKYSSRSAIELVRRVSARQIEAGLPEQPFDEWVRMTLAVDAIEWDVQVGCGDPWKNHEDDVCVAAVIPFAEEMNAGIVLRVGTTKHLQKRPTVYLLFRERRDQSRFHQIINFHELAEDAAVILGKSEPPSNPPPN